MEQQQGFRHIGTGNAVLMTLGDGQPVPDGYEPISLHEAVIQHERTVAALHDERDRRQADIAADLDAKADEKINTAISAAARLGLTNREAAILFGVPEIVDLPGKVPDETPEEPT